MRGISPVIATVIILAVTVAIAVAVIGWITGLFGATTSGTEQLQIYPDSNISASGKKLYLHILNKGNDLTIYKVVTCKETVATTITVPAGTETTLTISLNGTYTAGTSCDIKVYTKAGNVFTAVVNVVQ